MFKKYLNNYSARTQLSIFLFLWAAFFMLTNMVQLLVFNQYSGTDDVGAGLNYLIEHHPTTVKGLNALNSILLFFLPAFIFSYLVQPKPFNYLRLDKKHHFKTIILTIALGLFLIPALVSLGGFIKEINLFGEVGTVLQEQRDGTIKLYFSNEHWSLIVINLLLLGLLPAICEEFLFRGVLQRLVFESFKPAIWSILLPSIAFALLHFSVYEFIPIFLAGVLLSLIYHYSQSLKLSIIVHFINNGMQVVMMSLANGKEAEFSPAIYGIVFLISTLVLVVVWGRWRHSLNTPAPINIS